MFATSLTSVGALTSSLAPVRSRSDRPSLDQPDCLNALARTCVQSVAQAAQARLKAAMNQEQAFASGAIAWTRNHHPAEQRLGLARSSPPSAAISCWWGAACC